jgi:phosphatidylglycerophosphatase A
MPPDEPIEDARIKSETPAEPPEGAQASTQVEPVLTPLAPRRASLAFMLEHPAHLMALGLGSGLSPIAPGTVGTLFAWLSFHVLNPWLTPLSWGVVLVVGTLVGWWACTRTARALATADPSAVVWDEILAFWAVLWLVMPASWWSQFVAFVLFRFFDAAKPGPVGWADRRFKSRPGEPPGLRQGFGILFDDAIAALCTLLVMALWKAGTA